MSSDAVVLTAIAVSLGTVAVDEFVRTGLVPRLPTAVLAASIRSSRSSV
jgi:hypothetical protein